MADIKEIGTAFDRQFRNDLNDNFKALDAELVNSKEESSTAKQVAQQAKTESSSAKKSAEVAIAKAEGTQTQLDEIVLENGNSDAEVVQARGGEELLYQRLDKADRNLSAKTFGTVNVKEFGAVGDGVADDTLAIQSAIDSVGKGGRVVFPKGVYKISDSLRVYSESTYEGFNFGGTTIRQVANKPNFASDNLFVGRTSSSGRMTIKNFRLEGVQGNANNHGLWLRDYYTKVQSIYAYGLGGDGIFFDEYDEAGNLISYGSLVENEIRDCRVFNTDGYNYRVGRDNVAIKYTDGFFVDCLASANEKTPAHVYMGSSAGWKIDGIHTYGSPPPRSMDIYNSNHTRIDNYYIETFKERGLSCGRHQVSLTLGNGTIKLKDANASARALHFGVSSGYEGATVNISNLTLNHHNQDVNVFGVYSETSNIDFKVSNLSINGNFKDKVTRYYSPSNENIQRVENAIISGKLRDSVNKVSLRYEDVGMSQYATSGRIDSNTTSVQLKISNIPNYGKLIGTIHMSSASFDNGSKRAEFMAQVMVSAKLNGTDAWRAYVTNIIQPTGFATAPTITATNTSGNAGYLTVSFGMSDTDAKGIIGFNFIPSE